MLSGTPHFRMASRGSSPRRKEFRVLGQLGSFARMRLALRYCPTRANVFPVHFECAYDELAHLSEVTNEADSRWISICITMEQYDAPVNQATRGSC